MFAINGLIVLSPDEEVWSPVVSGESLTGLQKRSPYQQLQWRKAVADSCVMDWFQFDNTTLTSLTTRAPGVLNFWTTYIHVKCQSVTLSHRRGTAAEAVATFLVRVD